MTAVTRPVEGWTLPKEWYVSADLFDLELETVWRRGWFCVGHSGRIPNPGDFFTVSVGPDPIVVARDERGEVRALSNVCRHRSMPLAEGSGNTARLSCRYHGWTYALDGRLVGAPTMSRTPGFDRADFCLPRLAVEVWKNFIFVSFQDAPPPLAPTLTGVEQLIEPYRVESLVPAPVARADRHYRFNWKLFLEGSLECYHCDYLHPVQHDCCPTRNSRPDLLPGDPAAIALSVGTTHVDAGFVPPDYMSLFPPLPGLSIEHRQNMQWVFVLPNLVLSCYPDSVRGGVLLPAAVDSTRYLSHALYPAEVVEAESFHATFDRLLAAERPMMQQDLDACEAVQQGLRSVFSMPGPLSWMEGTLTHFNTWLNSRYSGDFELGTAPT